MLTQSSWRVAIPSLITAIRVLALPGVIWLSLHGLRLAAFGVYAVILLSDVMDGRVARWLAVETRFGAYFDVLADMTVLLGLLLTFSLRDALPIWLPAAPALVAAVFLLSSRRSAPRYDPLGKYYGTALYLFVGILLWGVGPRISIAIWVSIVALSGAVLGSRWIAVRLR